MNFLNFFKQKESKDLTKDWYSNKYQVVVVQRNMLFVITLLSLFAVTAAIIFVHNISGTKSLEPYVIEVSEKTGLPTIVEQDNVSRFTEDAVVKRYFINEFLQIAEGYDPFTYRQDYKKLRLMAAGSVYREFVGKLSSKNPDSPINVMGTRGKRAIKIKSVQFLEPQVVQVRAAIENSGVYTGQKRRDVVIYMSFKFTNLKLSMQDRMLNPLGFQVDSYRITDELKVE